MRDKLQRERVTVLLLLNRYRQVARDANQHESAAQWRFADHRPQPTSAAATALVAGYGSRRGTSRRLRGKEGRIPIGNRRQEL